MSRRRVGGIALAVLTLAILLSPGAVAQGEKGTLVIGTTDRITELSPANSYDYWTWHVFQQTAEALVTFKPGTTEIGPSLATSWTISPDGKVYTFKLRKGVTFTDGTPFDAAAVKWSIERALRLNGPEGGVALIMNIGKIDVVDDFTVRFTLKQPDATFLARMSDPIAPAMIFSPKSTPANEFAKGRYAGTGPYRLVQYVPEQRTVYEAYKGYWGPQPKSPRVITVFFADASALAAAVEAGQVDVGYRTFNPEDIVRLSKNPNLQVLRGPSMSVRYIVFNVTAKPFDNPKVRRAIAYAVDRERIVRDVFAGLNSPLYSMVPPGLWSHVPAFPKRNLDQARALLREAGYSTTKKLAITLWYTPLHYGTTEADVAAVVKSSLEQTGMIQVDVKSLEWGAYVKAMSKGEFGIFFLGWYPDFVDPDNFLAPWLTESPEGLGTFLNKATNPADKQAYSRFQKLLTDAKLTAEKSKRQAIYQEAQRLLAETAILLPLWKNDQQAVAIARKNVKGIVLDPTMNFRTWLIYKE